MQSLSLFTRRAPLLAARLVMALCAVALPVFVLPVSAQTATGSPQNRQAVTVDLKVYKVTRDDNGKEQLVDASRAKPGDVLEYRATYANVSKQEVKNLQATLPIPTATELLPATIAPKPALASADGRSFAAMPLMRAVKLPSGATQMQPLPLGNYRALRWPVGTLSAGEKATVSARVRLYGALATP